MRKEKLISIEGVIVSKSGLRVGGSNDLLQIGATDLTVIKHPVTLRPYIPGSSLKGRLRSELEMKSGKVGDGSKDKDGKPLHEKEPCSCARFDCLICRIFGPHKKPNHGLGPTRIIVRDSPVLSGGEIETKTENTISRTTGTSANVWPLERVVEGTTWQLKIGIQVWDIDSTCNFNGKEGGDALVEFVLDGLREVQKTGIGAGISKGSGEIEFTSLKVDGKPVQL